MLGCLPWHTAHVCATSALASARRVAGELCPRGGMPRCWLQQALVSTWLLAQDFAQALRQAVQSSWIRAGSFKAHPCHLPSEAPLAVVYTCQGTP